MIQYAVIVALVLCAFAWGIAAGTYKIFPFAQVQALHEAVITSSGIGSDGGYRENPAATQRGLAMADWDTRAEIVMIGDSITEAAPWKDMFPDADILGRGASGDTVSGVEARLDAILRAEPDRAFVLIGTNDLNLGNPVDEVLARYERVIERLQAAEVETTIQTVPPCEPVLDFCTGKRRDAEAALNEGIARLAREQGVRLIDLAADFPSGTEYRADGVHPTVSGYKAWRDVLAPHLAAQPQAEAAE
ncbi:MAG: GDSL-type esterase/lipase family protein [Erythrobacter sp.]|nr:GDSL-type esterase/lipase family protein [Erythrobacter sp.]